MSVAENEVQRGGNRGRCLSVWPILTMPVTPVRYTSCLSNRANMRTQHRLHDLPLHTFVPCPEYRVFFVSMHQNNAS